VTYVNNGHIMGLVDDGEIQPYSMGAVFNNIIPYKMVKYDYRKDQYIGRLKYIGYVRPKEMGYYVMHYVIDGTDVDDLYHAQKTYEFEKAEHTGYKIDLVMSTALPFLVELGYIEPRYAYVVKMKTMIHYDMLAQLGDDFDEDFEEHCLVIKSTLNKTLNVRSTTFRSRLHVFHKLEVGEIVYFPGGSRSEDWVYYNHSKYAKIAPIANHFAIVMNVRMGEMSNCEERFFPGLIIQNIMGDEEAVLLGEPGAQYFFLLISKFKMFSVDLPRYLDWEKDNTEVKVLGTLRESKKDELQLLKRMYPMEQTYINFRSGLLMWEKMLMVPCRPGCQVRRPQERVDSFGEDLCWGGIMSIFDE